MNTSLNSSVSQTMTIPDNSSNRWCRVYRPQPLATQRIILLPHASGSASFFRQWADLFPSNIEVVSVQYPGREDRIDDPLISDMELLVQGICSGLTRYLDKPYILFGHSMGGGIAYELYQTLQQQKLPQPKNLVISAFEAPSRKHQGELHKQQDSLLLDELKRLKGTGVDLNSYPELASMVLPLMRNDYKLIETYQPNSTRPHVNIPITLMVGDSDEELQSGDAEAWQQETTKEFQLLSFKGGHFYLTSEKSAVSQALIKLCQPVTPTISWPLTP